MRLWAKRTPEFPLWMYYVRAFLDILCGIIALFTLPFGIVCNLQTSWAGRMIRNGCNKGEDGKINR
ncbi:MAG: hypothetical protein GWN55_16015 [Phycisphaerae bacterium]|nr:hypothetical protein [Phycisphaerae bacterium]